MNQTEMKQGFSELYDYMAQSKDPENMKAFGKVMKEMFMWLTDYKPDAAQEWLDELSAIRWKQYLTQKEAERIIEAMVPKAPWKIEVWKSAMASLGFPIEKMPEYNCYALWVEMNKQYSDHAESIARDILKKPLSDIPTDQVVTMMHSLALDVLEDRDARYDIRRYFSL